MTLTDTFHTFEDADRALKTANRVTSSLSDGAGALAGSMAVAGAVAETVVASFKLASGVSAVVRGVNSAKTAEALALTSACALTPEGWGRVALATSAVAVGAVATYGVLNMTLKANLSQAHDVQQVTNAIRTVMA